MQAALIAKLEKDISAAKKRAGIPASHPVQTDELVQVEEEKNELIARLSREREEKEKMAKRIEELESRATELQTRWDMHSCHAAETSSGTGSATAQLSTAMAEIEVLENQTTTAK